jgi:acetate kinase
MREIEDAANDGHQRAQTALEMFAYRVKKYIGSYAAAMGGVDTIIFTGGIGENDTETRKRVLNGMEFLGIDLDESKLNVRGKEPELTLSSSKVKVLVVPTDEEMMIAKDTFEIVG